MADDAAFGRDLVAARARPLPFARRLAGTADGADDLLQQTMLKAWAARASFEPGTNLRGWLWMILRNEHLTRALRERRWHGGSIDDVTADRLPARAATQEHAIHLADALAALRRLPAVQAEAVALIAAGERYDDAARAAGVVEGTIKSRVWRGREALARAVG